MSTVKYTSTFQLSQPVAILFPLFSPEGETLWVPNWDYENIMESTSLHEDYVFLTVNHDHAASTAIWLVKRYEPEKHLVQFYKVEPEEKVGVITVQCAVAGESSTEVTVTYEYIGLSEKGDKFISSFSPETYAEFIGEWKALLEKYFDNK